MSGEKNVYLKTITNQGEGAIIQNNFHNIYFVNELLILDIN